MARAGDVDLEAEIDLSYSARSHDSDVDTLQLARAARPHRSKHEANTKGAGRPAPEDLSETLPEAWADVDAEALLHVALVISDGSARHISTPARA